MANKLAARPWELDTAGATVLANFPVKIGAVQWYGYSDAAHTAVLTDKNGIVITAFNGDTDLTTQQAILNEWYNGLICPTLGSGKVLVHLI